MSVDQVTFRQPIYVGELVSFLACVNFTGRSSMEIAIKVVTENLRTHEIRHVNSCYFTMVAADDARKVLRTKLRQVLEAQFNAAKSPTA